MNLTAKMLVMSIALGSSSIASAQSAPAATAAASDGPVTVVVAIPTPPTIPRAGVEAGMKKAVPQYRTVPGLLRKYFTIGDTSFGGVYLFTSRAAAQTWFNEAWMTRVAKTYGAPATITYYDVPIVLDNAEIPASVVAPR